MILFCLSIAFQLAGALILLLYGVSTKRDNIIKSFSASSFIWRDGNTKKINDLSKEYQQRYRQAFLNKTAFFYLTLGYTLSIWAEKGSSSPCLSMLITVALTILLLVVGKVVVNQCLMKRSSVMAPITSEDLERFGIEPDMELISNTDIDKMLREE